MKKALIVLLSIASLIVIAALSVYFLFRSEVKKHLIPETQKIIKETTNLNVSFSDFEFSLANLLKFEPSIVIKDLKVENALTAKKVTASLYLTDLLNRKFKVKNFEFSNLVLNLKQNSKGEFELKGLNLANQPAANSTQKAQQKEAQESFLEEIELKNFVVTNSTVNLELYQVSEPVVLNNFNLKLSDFKLDKEERLTTKLNLDSNIFNSEDSSLSLNGSLGPIDPKVKSLPVNLEQKIKISIASVPAALLQQNLGELVQISDAYIIEDAKLSGDFLATSSGTGNLKIDNLEIGNSKETSLQLNSSFPISFKLKNKYTPTLNLSTDNSTINLKSKDNDSGKLEFDADIAMNLKTGFINGSSSGNITGINVKNLLAALTDLRGVLSGEVFLENYNISFAGSTPKRLFKSAKGSAHLEMRDGDLYILDTIVKYRNIADQVLKGLGSTVKTEKLSGKFKTMKSELKLADKILAVENIDIETAEEHIKINGRGEVRNLQWLVFDIFLDVPRLEPVPLSIRGTIEAPKIYPNVKKITKKQSEEVINNLIQYGLESLQEAQGSTNAAADSEPAAKKQSFGSLLKDSLKNGLLEAPPEPETSP